MIYEIFFMISLIELAIITYLKWDRKSLIAGGLLFVNPLFALIFMLVWILQEIKQ